MYQIIQKDPAYMNLQHTIYFVGMTKVIVHNK